MHFCSLNNNVMNKLNHPIFSSLSLILYKDHIISWSINMGLNIASVSHPLSLSLFSIFRFLVALHYLYVVYSASRTFSCLVSRNYYVKQMSNNNKMAFSQLPYFRSKASCGHIMQRLFSQEDAACSSPTQDVMQEHGFATVALNSPRVTG